MSTPRTGTAAVSVTAARAPGTAASDNVTAAPPIAAACTIVTLRNFLTYGT